MSQETAFLLVRLRDLSNNFHALSDAIMMLETSPDISTNETNKLILTKLKVDLCETMLSLNDVFDSTIYNWSKELEGEV